MEIFWLKLEKDWLQWHQRASTKSYRSVWPSCEPLKMVQQLALLKKPKLPWEQKAMTLNGQEVFQLRNFYILGITYCCEMPLWGEIFIFSHMDSHSNGQTHKRTNTQTHVLTDTQTCIFFLMAISNNAIKKWVFQKLETKVEMKRHLSDFSVLMTSVPIS